MRRKGAFGNASAGRGFVVARLPAGPGGGVCWSAPSFFSGQSTATGFQRGANSILEQHAAFVGRLVLRPRDRLMMTAEVGMCG